MCARVCVHLKQKPRGAPEPNKEETNRIEECEAEVEQKAFFFSRLEIETDDRRERKEEERSDRNLNTKVILTRDPYTLTRVCTVLLDCDIIPKSWRCLSQLGVCVWGGGSVTGVKDRRCSGSVDATGASLSLFLCRITPSPSSSSQHHPPEL